MNLFSKLLKLFGKKTDSEFDFSIWQLGEQKRIKEMENEIKIWLIPYLKENETLPFSWESGGDDGFVTIESVNETYEDAYINLEEYLINQLEIPTAGEFEMNGKGTLYIENNFVKVKYSSTMKETIDFNEETEEAIYSEEEFDSGDSNLFAI